MPARRIKQSEKLLRIIEGLAEEIGVYLDYGKMRQRLHGSWDYETNFSKAIANAKRYGYLEIVEKDNKKSILITKKGRFRIWKPRIVKEWDGRWRLVGFDIPEKRRKKRDSFRTALRAMGFKQMQKSLWICPYDVSEEIEKVMDMLDLEYEIDYFIADAITNKEKYIDLFDLNQQK